jgi:hypothetical protein
MPAAKIIPQHHPAGRSFRFPLSVRLFVPLCLSGQDPRSTLVERPLQISLFSAKQTQFSQGQNQRNPLYTLSFRPKARFQRAEAEESTSILSPSPKTPIWPNLPKSHGLYYAKRTQFSYGQNQCNLLCRKDLPKQTTPGHSKKTNPNEPNSSKRKNDPTPLPRKALWKTSPPSDPGKTNPIKPNSPSKTHAATPQNANSKPSAKSETRFLGVSQVV